MTVETTTYFTEWQDANGVNKNWVYNFPMPDDNSVSILVRDVATPLVVEKFTSDFTRVEVDENNGTIIYPVLGAALGATKQVRIVRDVPYTQMTQIGSEGAFNPKIHEDALDKLTMLVQQLYGTTTRSLRFPLGDNATELPTDRAGHTLVFDSSGNPINGPTVGDIANAATNAAAATASAKAAAASAAAAAEIAAHMPEFGVTSFNGRTGAVEPQEGDYTPAQLGAVPTYRKVKVGTALSLDGVAGSDADPAEGDLAADRLVALLFASQAEAEAGTATNRLMTPLRVAEAISALGGNAYFQEFNTSGVWTKPAKISPNALVIAERWGGGGGGHGNGGGGGGGAYLRTIQRASTLGATETVTVGSGGTVGGFGGNTIFAGWTAYGGGPGYYAGGGGGGATGAGGNANGSAGSQIGGAGGWPEIFPDIRYGGWGGDETAGLPASAGDPSFYGGGGGGSHVTASNVGGKGGDSVYGGGGGAGWGSRGNGARGTSLFGGNGGAVGEAGTVPGGGGGSSMGGAPGRVRIYVVG